MKPKNKKQYRIFKLDPWIEPYEDDIRLRMSEYEKTKSQLLNGGSLVDFANAHEYFGFHRVHNGWMYREWAPAADALYLMGDFNDWNKTSHPLQKNEDGTWEIFLQGQDALRHGTRVKVVVHHDGEAQDKIPLYIRRVIQEVHDDGTVDFLGQIWAPEEEFRWTDGDFKLKRSYRPIIYETHIGMAQEKEAIGTYKEFEENILPRIKEAGYNTIQIMAIMQHPYYGSFGYHVTNFFAPSSWFGTPEELKSLINKAHEMGLAVLMDIVHSHAARNTAEGINRFDGTQTQFFYPGEKGEHPQWDSMCFNYRKPEVLHFLLSNAKYWMEEFHFDGFRFDGVTSMLYNNHGLGVSFDDYSKYFSLNTNIEAGTYLQLATELLHTINPNCVLIAEDMSGMPGLCLPIKDGGYGFDYRLAMGMPDFWDRTLEKRDEDWDMYELWYELTTHRDEEKRIAYAESHDQAIVGSKTIFFRLTGPEIYWHMMKMDENYIIDRALALDKMIRFATISMGADGYLNFMGNEFGHPEWIDFPRQENDWSYKYCRRQWSLVDNRDLKYEYLGRFDHDMLHFSRTQINLRSGESRLLWIDQDRKVIAFRKRNLVYLFNWHPTNSYESFQIPVHEKGKFKVIFSTDRMEYGGYGRIDENVIYESQRMEGGEYEYGITIYSPSRTALVLKKLND